MKKPPLPYLLLIGFIILHTALTLTFSLTLRYEFKTSGYDGALFAQLLYNVIHGNGLVTSLFPPGISQPWLGIHFSPILYTLVPVYDVFPHIETLLVIHSALIALAAWPIFLTAEYLLRSRWQALAASLLYLVNPYVINAAVWDFHEIAFAPLILAFMLWAIVCKKRAHLVIFSVLLLTVKEHYGLAVFGSGLLWAWHWRDIRFGAAMAMLGLAAFALILFVIMPHYAASNHLVWLETTQANWVQRFTWLHDPFGDGSPILHVIAGGSLYIAHLAAALWFLPLVEFMWWLPGLADITVNTLATGPMMKSEFSYHSAALQPVVVIAGIVCVARRFGKGKLTSGDALAAMLVTSLFVAYIATAGANIWEFSSPRPTLLSQDRKALATINHIIPQDAAVAAQANALPHLDMRKRLYTFPEYTADATYIVLYAGYMYHTPSGVLDSPYGGRAKPYFAAVTALLADRSWGVTYYKNNWLLLEKGTHDNVTARTEAMNAFAKTEADYDALPHKPLPEN